MPVISPSSVESRIGSIDGLRGIAILSVIFLHWFVRPYSEGIVNISDNIYNILNAAAHGVDIFFVVSGFLIGRILLTNADSPNLARTFYIRRFLRIIPLYFSVIILILMGRNFFDSYPTDAVPIWTYFVFINNMFDPYWTVTPEFGPFWSLAVEEQFYLSSCLIVVCFGRKGVVRLACLLVLASLAVRIMNVVSAEQISWWPLLIGHSDPIGVGLLVAALMTNEKARLFLSLHLSRVILLRTLCLIGFLAAGQFRQAEAIGLDILLISLAVGCWIIRIELQPSKSVLSFMPLRCIGEMCFSLYILHQAWLYFAVFYLGMEFPTPLELLIHFICLAAVCRLIWIYVESPLIRLGRRWSYDDEDNAKASGARIPILPRVSSVRLQGPARRPPPGTAPGNSPAARTAGRRNWGR